MVASGIARAADSASSKAAIAEMKEMFGGVPTELQLYPESARAAGWEMMKSTDLNENTALPSKTRELIGLAVAAQIPCQYCVYYHIKAAKAAGASQEEIREAVHQASLTRHWSTILSMANSSSSSGRKFVETSAMRLPSIIVQAYRLSTAFA